MTDLEEIKLIKQFVEDENNSYSSLIDLYKTNRVRIIDIINFLEVFRKRKKFVLMKDNQYVFDSTCALLNMDAIYQYEGNENTKLIDVEYDEDRYCFYFKKKKLTRKCHVITLKRKTETHHEYELITSETTYPESVAQLFVNQNVHVKQTIDIEEDMDIMELIDDLESEKQYYKKYDETNNITSAVVNSCIQKGIDDSKSDDISHSFQIKNGKLMIYRDQVGYHPSLLMNPNPEAFKNESDFSKIVNKYLEKQTIALSDFKDKDLQNVVCNYLRTMINLRGKEDDGINSYETFLKILKENKGTFASIALNLCMIKHKSGAANWQSCSPIETFKLDIKVNQSLLEKINEVKRLESIDGYLAKYTGDSLKKEREKKLAKRKKVIR